MLETHLLAVQGILLYESIMRFLPVFKLTSNAKQSWIHRLIGPLNFRIASRFGTPLGTSITIADTASM